ncbi:MAG: GNAT family N-acetyltransferase [Asgard group archaeon]|nr:GNAT family N-acetyltransferase [Asgard group archaeon]
MIEYRLASVKDIEILVDLRIKFLIEAERINTDEHSQELKESLISFFQRNIPKGNYISWIAFEGEKVVATSGVSFHEVPPTFGNISGKEAYIMNMYSLPEYRRHGIGTKLLNKLIEKIEETGIKKIRLHFTHIGKSLYEKVGFQSKNDEMMMIIK